MMVNSAANENEDKVGSGEFRINADRNGKNAEDHRHVYAEHVPFACLHQSQDAGGERRRKTGEGHKGKTRHREGIIEILFHARIECKQQKVHKCKGAKRRCKEHLINGYLPDPAGAIGDVGIQISQLTFEPRADAVAVVPLRRVIGIAHSKHMRRLCREHEVFGIGILKCLFGFLAVSHAAKSIKQLAVEIHCSSAGLREIQRQGNMPQR